MQGFERSLRPDEIIFFSGIGLMVGTMVSKEMLNIRQDIVLVLMVIGALIVLYGFWLSTRR